MILIIILEEKNIWRFTFTIIKILSKQNWDLLVVDHYALDIRWELALRASVSKIMVIDDIADRIHDCDFLLDQNYYECMNDRYAGKVPAKCSLLLGPIWKFLLNGITTKELLTFGNESELYVNPVQTSLYVHGVDTVIAETVTS